MPTTKVVDAHIHTDVGDFYRYPVPIDEMHAIFHDKVLDLPPDFYYKLLQSLVDDRIYKPSDPSEFSAEDRATHKGGQWALDAVNLHPSYPEDIAKQPGEHEKNVLSFIQQLTKRIYNHDRQTRGGLAHASLHPEEARTFLSELNSPLKSAGGCKPDVVLVPKNMSQPLEDFQNVLSVLQIKYSHERHLWKEAMFEIISYSWYMFAQHDTRRHVLGATLCGPHLSVCLVDHGGAVATAQVDINDNPLTFLTYLSVMLMGSPAILGYGDYGRSGDELKMHEGSLKLDILARVFCQWALTGRYTRVFIARPDEYSWNPDDWIEDMRRAAERLTQEDSSSDSPPPSPAPSSNSSIAPPCAFNTPLSQPSPALPSQVAVKDCWTLSQQIPEGYFLDQLAGIEGIDDKAFAFNHGFPTKITEQLLTQNSVTTGRLELDSTSLYHPVPQGIFFQKRHHYRLVMKDIIVPLLWFSTRLEFFAVLLNAVEAHKFATNTRKILHGDISPWNIWIWIKAWQHDFAVPKWPTIGQPEPRWGLLGDWGLASVMPGFVEQVWYPLPIHHHSKVAKPFDRMGTTPFMATHLLGDEYGEHVSHQPAHDLESFFWVIIWSMVNLTGPFNSKREWAREIASGGEKYVPPPAWLRWNGTIPAYGDIVRDRVQQGQQGISRFFHSFWRNDAIMNGVTELFSIFLPTDIVAYDGEGNHFNFKSSTPHCDHDRLIKILKDIILSLGSETDQKPDINAARGRFLGSFLATRHYGTQPGVA